MAESLRFLFAGTAKSGTTSIYHYLQQHPDVHIPAKETFYFLKEIYQHNHLPYPMQRAKEGLILNEDSYHGLYTPFKDGAVGEVGTGYLYHWKKSIPLIQETLGKDTRILIVLRHPTDRCYSSYMHFAKDLHEPLSFAQAMETEDERMAQGWDFMWHHKAMGFYAEQVKAFVEAFAHVKVIIYEEFAADPAAAMKEVFQFLEVDPLQPLVFDTRHNPSGVPKNALLQKLITHENPVKSIFRPLFRLLFAPEKRAQIRKKAKSKNLDKGPGLTEEWMSTLDQLYSADIAALEKIIGREIEAWRR